MAKSKKNKNKGSGKDVSTTGQHPSKNKLKGDGKPKKATPEDHLEHIPFRLREIMKSKDRMKTGSLGAKKVKKAISSHRQPTDSMDGNIDVPHFKKGKHESKTAYLQRMENAAQHVLFLTNNQVDRQPELDVDKQEKPADTGKSVKKKEYAKNRLDKIQQKKLDKQVDKMEKEMFLDYVPFGEVTMAPPSLSIKPRKAEVKTQKAPKQLLLNSLLGHTAVSTAKPSMARQRLMEEERQRVVKAYRQLKQQKQQQPKARTDSLGKLMNLA
ncbi:coiled-coil domain-containing protein 137 [Cololabis saira]|uniref:coiled-coil domain-containing protein 137 n=1 Tax=Cololabis saira TaxID=129043 RepID=UPI002AD47B9E|nr:coiled-coil domain-containing protein 137 [Cololabis saira]